MSNCFETRNVDLIDCLCALEADFNFPSNIKVVKYLRWAQCCMSTFIMLILTLTAYL